MHLMIAGVLMNRPTTAHRNEAVLLHISDSAVLEIYPNMNLILLNRGDMQIVKTEIWKCL
jgi:hypothetical protein